MFSKERIYEHYVNGKAWSGVGGESIPLQVRDSSKEIGRVLVAGTSEVDEAANHATYAFGNWSGRTPGDRLRIFRKFGELVKGNAKELAESTTSVLGGSLEDEMDSIQRGLQAVTLSCEILERRATGVKPRGNGSGQELPWCQPLGVCTGVTPEIHPVMHGLWTFPVAICWGNTFILNPSPAAPAAPLRLAELFTEAGGPPGVLNVLNGGDGTAEALAMAHGIGAFKAFAPTGRDFELYTLAMGTGKPSYALGSERTTWSVCPQQIMFTPWRP